MLFTVAWILLEINLEPGIDLYLLSFIQQTHGSYCLPGLVGGVTEIKKNKARYYGKAS